MINDWRKCDRKSIEQADPLHIVPEFPGEPGHVVSRDCWCQPKFDGEVYIHQRPQ